MVAFLTRKGLISPLGLAAMAAAMAGGAALFVPMEQLEQWSIDSGIAAIVDAAQPPLGLRAKAAFAFVAAVAAGGGIWAIAAAFAAMMPRRRRRRSRPPEAVIALGDDSVPMVRRADAHPDAPPRPPVLATRDLGIPFLDVHAPAEEAAVPEAIAAEADAPVAEPVATVPEPVMPEEQPLPQDLDTPLALVDPVSFTALAPPAPVVPPSASAEPSAATEEPPVRIETFELTPPVRRPAPHRPLSTLRAVPEEDAPPPEPETLAAPQTEATIHALLDRLERGIAAREQANAQRRRAQGLQDTLRELRQMARRG